METSSTHGETTEHKGGGYEHSLLNMRAIVKFLAILFICTALVDVIVAGVLKYLEYDRAHSEQPVSAALINEQRQLPPEPRLQGAPGTKYELEDPALEYRAYEKEEEDKLNSYGWVDQSKNQARIPIDEAMKLVLPQLPTKPTEQPSPTTAPSPAAGQTGNAQQGTSQPGAAQPSSAAKPPAAPSPSAKKSEPKKQ